MDCSIKIVKIETLHQIDGYWTKEDYLNILDLLDFTDVQESSKQEILEYLFMGLYDLKPEKAAEVLLTYKLGNLLSKGQIQNIAEEMLEEKVAEEYSDISLHYPLYNINQLLFMVFKTYFPDTKASRILFQFDCPHNMEHPINKEIILKGLSKGFKKSNIITRLYPEALTGTTAFPEADHILWELKQFEKRSFLILTSDYWINDDDFESYEFKGRINNDVPSEAN